MTLREEVKDIYDKRPTPEQKKEERLESRQNKAYHSRKGENLPTPAMRRAYSIVTIVMGIAAVVFLVMLIVINPLPADLTIVLVLFMLGMLAAAAMLFRNRKKWKRIAGIIIGAVFLLIFIVSTNFMLSTYAMLNRIVDSGINATGPKANAVDVVNEPFNIYLTGIDQWEDEKGLDLERSDVNMIITVNPKTKKILLTSIPRDTYVKLHTAKQMDKLTHTGVYGVDETLNTVHDWLGVDINYYVKMNFSAMVDIIDAMGGINVYSPVEFESDLNDYIFYKGWNELDGKGAMYFARERHAFEGKDSVRVENQQRVMKAMIKKMTSSTTLLTRYGDIMVAAGDNLQTNMTPDEMTALVKMQIGELADWDIESQKIEGVYDQDYVASLDQSMKYDVYRPYSTSVRSCTENIRAVMNPDRGSLSDLEKRNRSFFVNMIKRMTGADKENEDPEEEQDS